jgi:hypothetical protein
MGATVGKPEDVAFVRLSPGEKAILVALATSQDRTQSAVLRRLIREAGKGVVIDVPNRTGKGAGDAKGT